MGKVHGSLARAGKVKSQTPKWLAPGTGEGDGDGKQAWSCLVELGSRTPREEKATQGPSEEEAPVHQTVRQRYDDRWQEKDEPQPNLIIHSFAIRE
ncbi:MAG: hypothetical protein M1834_009282 [Cirrosporium novae-zelandiae]|nr:MAG: hypothetical protein M1834_009282 [Cirrosporium novae-zelandiae]